MIGKAYRYYRRHGPARFALRVAQKLLGLRPRDPAAPAGSRPPRYHWPALSRSASRADTLAVLRAPGAFGSPLQGALTVTDTQAAADLVLGDRVSTLLVELREHDAALRDLLRLAHDRGVATAALVPMACEAGLDRPGAVTAIPAPGSTSSNAAATAKWQMLNAFPVLVARDNAGRELAARLRKTCLSIEADASLATVAEDLCTHRQRALRPRVSIIGILYNKSAEIVPVLESYWRQSYEGELEILLVDDCSPDDSVARVERFLAAPPKRPRGLPAPVVRILRNAANAGNCASRNRAIAEAAGDLLVVIDSDCVVNRDFVRRHVEAHAFGDCEFAIGPFNIETHGAPPRRLLRRYEHDAWAAYCDAGLQDRVHPAGFLNFITRNVSIRRDAIPAEGLFDPLFGYSADPASGYGWEDVEAGYRLYRAGLRSKFVPDAFAIHVTPPAEHVKPGKAVRSLRNFRRLCEKHPEFADVSRRWAEDTYRRICNWCDEEGAPRNDDHAFVDALLRPAAPAIRLQRPLRVLSYRWHVPHQYEIYKLPADFTLVRGLGTPMSDAWDYGQRPLRDNVRFADAARVRASDYDVAILHFDENVLDPQNTNDMIGPDWGAAFRWFVELAGLPKVAICHGTPQFHGMYDFDYAGADLMQPIEASRRRLVDFVGDMPIVCNSHQAMAEWGFRDARVIWHGFDPTEFPPATYERGILSPMGPLVLSRPHYRGFFLYREVFEGHLEALAPETLRVPEPHPSYDANALAWAKYRNYVDAIRSYSTYFNPTLLSPMPRARAEPMMCGVVTVSATNHDVDRFIRNGVNGFHSREAGELREALYFLKRNPEAARRIGAESRRTALREFNHHRFLGEWSALLAGLTR